MAEAALCYMLLIAFLFPLCQLGLPSPIPSPDISAWGFAQEAWGFFYRVHILRCPGPAEAQPVYQSRGWSHDVVWTSSVWSAPLPAPEGTGSGFPSYWHRAGRTRNSLAVRMEVLKALVHRRSLRHSLRHLSVLGAGCSEKESPLQGGNCFSV